MSTEKRQLQLPMPIEKTSPDVDDELARVREACDRWAEKPSGTDFSHLAPLKRRRRRG